MKTIRYGIVSNFLLALGATIAMLSAGCGTMDGTGSSTQSGITGKIFNDDGTPAKNATVSIIASGYIPSISGVGKSAPVDSIVTNDSGTYSIRWLQPGTYNIFGKKDDRFCYQDSVQIDSSTATIANDTLKEAGSLSGIVRLQPGDDSRTILILIYGSNTFTYPGDFTGHFSITSLAEGNYHIKVLTTIQGYIPKDTVITIVPGRNDTLPDTMRLEYSGIPTVTGLVAAWDSLLLKTNLSWNKLNTSIIAGYNIYRGMADSTFNDQPVNAAMIVTNTFIDTFNCATAGTWQDKRYVYRVKPINKNNDIGLYSNADTITASSAYKPVKTITGIPNDSTDAFIYRNRIYLTNRMERSIDVFDTAGTPIQSFGSSGSAPLVRPQVVSALNGFVYVVDQERRGTVSPDTSSIKMYDTTGNFLSRIPIAGLITGMAVKDTGEFYTLSISNDSISLQHRNGSGEVLDSMVIRKSSASISSFWILPVMRITGSQIVVMGALSSDTTEMLTLNSDLSVSKSVKLTVRNLHSFGIDQQGMAYCLAPAPDLTSNKVVSVYDGNINLYAQFPPTYAISLTVDQAGKIYCKGGNLTIYEKR